MYAHISMVNSVVCVCVCEKGRKERSVLYMSQSGMIFFFLRDEGMKRQTWLLLLLPSPLPLSLSEQVT